MLQSVILLIILIVLNAIFASAEIAVISMNNSKLKKMTGDGDKRAVKLSKLTNQPSRFLATIQVAITLSGFLNSAFAADNFSEPLTALLIGTGIPIPENVLKSISMIIITIVLSYFNIVFGELVPKRIAMKKADSLALALSGLLYGVSKFFAPLVALLTVSTNGLLRIFGINPNDNEETLTEEEIRMMLIEGNQQGILESYENEIIQNVFEFDDIPAQQICTHRLDVHALDVDDDLEEWNHTILSTRHTYYPIYQDSKDQIIGILDTRDYFRMKKRTKEKIKQQAVHPVYFVPEDMKADILFQNMKSKRTYFAVLLDEHGGMSGIITVQDLIEELVGDMYEANDGTKEKIQSVSENCWNISGDADLDDVQDTVSVDLPTDLYDTFNGFVCSIVERIPKDGEQFQCSYEDLDIHVHTVTNHIIRDTTVTKNTNTHQEEKTS